MPQIERKFDRESVTKIIKGALIAGTGAAALFLLDFVGTIDIGNPTLASFIALIVPFAVNTIKEFLKGEKVNK